MPTKRSIFFDDWRACLRAHYEHVIRAGDAITEPTLRHVLQQAGLSDEALDWIRVQAFGSPAQPDEAAPEEAYDAAAPEVAYDAAVPEEAYDAAALNEAEYSGEMFDSEHRHEDDIAYEAESDQDEPYEGELYEGESYHDAPPDDLPPDDPPPPPAPPTQLSLF